MTVLRENASSGSVAPERGNVFRVRLISEGQGSSGFYAGEVLQKYLPTALPKGSHVYLNHMSENEREAGIGRDIKDIAGVFESDPQWDDKDRASYADIRFGSHVSPMIREFMNDIGVSIEIHSGAIDNDGNIVEMNYTPHNSLAIVPVPGARGKVVQMIESFRSAESKKEIPQEENNMDEQKVADLVAKAMSEALKPVLEALTAEPQTEEAKTSDIAEAVVAAGLTEHGRKNVYALIESGRPLAEAIEDVKSYEKAVREAVIAESKKNDEDGDGYALQEGATAPAPLFRKESK